LILVLIECQIWPQFQIKKFILDDIKLIVPLEST
jgi:hypothetical protein